MVSTYYVYLYCLILLDNEIKTSTGKSYDLIKTERKSGIYVKTDWGEVPLLAFDQGMSRRMLQHHWAPAKPLAASIKFCDCLHITGIIQLYLSNHHNDTLNLTQTDQRGQGRNII